jgi:hypothetical protein
MSLKVNINYCINNNTIIGLKNIVSEKNSCPRGMSKLTYLLSLSSSYQPSPEFNDSSICYDYCDNSGVYIAD